MELNELLANPQKYAFDREAREIIKRMDAQERIDLYTELCGDTVACMVVSETSDYWKDRFAAILSEYVDVCELFRDKGEVDKGEVKEPQKGVEKQQNTVFAIPQYLKTDRMERILKALESTEGYDGKPVIDRSCTPWVVSSMPDWGHVAVLSISKIGARMRWADWGKMIGKDKESLKKAYYKSDKNTKSKKRIENVINYIT